MEKLKTVESYVTKELTENYQSRRNDNELFIGVLRRIGANTNRPFQELLRDKSLPSLKTIERARRKVQEKNPALKDAATAAYRKDEEGKYIQYSQEKI